MVHVTSEIGRLRQVLMHEPGPEVDRMVPPMMEDLLFDDILFGDRARDEHRRFRRLLQLLGIEVVEANDLLSAVIAVGAAGFALSVIDLLLGAPDLAFPQVLVEVITLVLLIRMIMTRRDTSRQTPRDTLRTAVVLLAGGVFLVAAFLAAGGIGTAGSMPAFGQH